MHAWLTKLCPDLNADDLVRKLEAEGFSTVEDLRLLEENDLKSLGVNLCGRRKIMRELTRTSQAVVKRSPISELEAKRRSINGDVEPLGIQKSGEQTPTTLTPVGGRPDTDSVLAGSEPENAGKRDLECVTSRSSDVFGEENHLTLQAAVHSIIQSLGENPSRDGLQRTPKRVADAMLSMTGGYDMDLHTLVNDAIFEEDHEGMVLVRDIEFFSLCEHHMLPFYGKIHIAYIPNGRIIGLSKLARIAHMFARRLQVQERLTRQVAEAVAEALQPRGIAVFCEASHGCMIMRGVQNSTSSTTTSCFRGEFETDMSLRQEFLQSIHRTVR